MQNVVNIGDRKVGKGYPVYKIAEIGINHNGDMGVAKRLIDASVTAGFDAVKFQKRTPELCVPKSQQSVLRETPWGKISYLEYRHKVEFGENEYREIDAYCRERQIHWFASCWDLPSLDFIEQFKPVAHKVASASLTDARLLSRLSSLDSPVILSTGMSTMDQIDQAVELLAKDRLLIAHSTSSYPCAPEELNLRMIRTLSSRYGIPTGYSGHEEGIYPTSAAVAAGACFIERHVTLDKGMWGSDHAASLEPDEMKELSSNIDNLSVTMGDGIKKVYPSELSAMEKLRVIAPLN